MMHSRLFQKSLLILCQIQLLIPLNVHATPPREINLEYNNEQQILTVKAKHSTKDEKKHYLRKAEVYVNNLLLDEVRSNIQFDPHQWLFDFPVALNEDDLVAVKIFCSEGGSMAGDLIIKRAEE